MVIDPRALAAPADEADVVSISESDSDPEPCSPARPRPPDPPRSRSRSPHDPRERERRAAAEDPLELWSSEAEEADEHASEMESEEEEEELPPLHMPEPAAQPAAPEVDWRSFGRPQASRVVRGGFVYRPGAFTLDRTQWPVSRIVREYYQEPEPPAPPAPPALQAPSGPSEPSALGGMSEQSEVPSSAVISLVDDPDAASGNAAASGDVDVPPHPPGA